MKGWENVSGIVINSEIDIFVALWMGGLLLLEYDRGVQPPADQHSRQSQGSRGCQL